MTARWLPLVVLALVVAGCSGPAPEAAAPAPAQAQPAAAQTQETVTPIMPGGGAATPVAGTDSVRGAGGGGVQQAAKASAQGAAAEAGGGSLGTTLEGPDDTGADSGE